MTYGRNSQDNRFSQEFTEHTEGGHREGEMNSTGQSFLLCVLMLNRNTLAVQEVPLKNVRTEPLGTAGATKFSNRFAWYWQRKVEFGAFAGFAVYSDCTPVGMHKFLCNGQSQAGP